MRPDRGGRLLDPGAMVSTRREGNVPAGIRRFPAASPTPPPKQPSAGARQSRGINEGSPYSPVRSSSRPWPPVMRGDPPAFPQAPHPAVTNDACQGEDRPPDTGPRSRSRHQPHLQPTRSTHNVRPSCRTPTLGSSLLGRGEPTAVDHSSLQPLLDQSPGGEPAERGQQVVDGRSGRTPPSGPRRAPTARAGFDPSSV